MIRTPADNAWCWWWRKPSGARLGLSEESVTCSPFRMLSLVSRCRLPTTPSLWRSCFGLERGFWSAAPLLQAHPEPGLKTSGVAPPILWRLKIVCCLSIRKELHDATSTSRCQAKACSSKVAGDLSRMKVLPSAIGRARRPRRSKSSTTCSREGPATSRSRDRVITK
jgi:hypothetical protein